MRIYFRYLLLNFNKIEIGGYIQKSNQFLLEVEEQFNNLLKIISSETSLTSALYDNINSPLINVKNMITDGEDIQNLYAFIENQRKNIPSAETIFSVEFNMFKDNLVNTYINADKNVFKVSFFNIDNAGKYKILISWLNPSLTKSKHSLNLYIKTINGSYINLNKSLQIFDESKSLEDYRPMFIPWLFDILKFSKENSSSVFSDNPKCTFDSDQVRFY